MISLLEDRWFGQCYTFLTFLDVLQYFFYTFLHLFTQLNTAKAFLSPNEVHVHHRRNEGKVLSEDRDANAQHMRKALLLNKPVKARERGDGH